MWLLAAAVRQAIEQAQQNGLVPTLEQQAQYEASYGLSDDSQPRILTVAGDVAEIAIQGAITQRPSFLAMLFGGGNVTYPDIISALAQADQNPAVSRAVLKIDSPGGQLAGLFDTVAAIQSFSKPLQAVVSSQAASAAYALASQADEIIATNRAAMFGSIGIVAGFEVDPSVVQITSTAAPKKRPDPTTPEGQAVIREELDALHEIFADAIATGRGTDIETVNTRFGQGAVLLAADAQSRGMIDAIAPPALGVVKSQPSASGGTKHHSRTGPMNLAELKAQHPDVYASAVQEGVTQERDRVSSLLTLGQGSGLMDDAIKAIEGGERVTQAMTAKHLMAAANRRDQDNRDQDDAAAAAALAGAADGGQGAASAAEQVCAAVEARLGITAGVSRHVQHHDY